MSLSSALGASVAALRAQSAVIGVVSENIANSSTTAYKTKEVSFAALVTGAGTNGSGSVMYQTSQNISAQGQITSTSSTTDIAIQGSGFFVVTDDLDNESSAYVYSRNGSFTQDKDGNLVNGEGYYLLGWATDANGNVLSASSNDLTSLEPISLDSVKGSAKATSSIDIVMNLPANAEVGGSFSNTVEIFDSLGVSHTVTMTWTKDATDPNTWAVELAQPHLTSDASISPTATGTLSPSELKVVFNGDGTLQSVDYDPGTSTIDTDTIAIADFTTGAEDSDIALNLGTTGKSDGLTQYASTSATPDIEIGSIVQDGLRLGKLSSVSIDDNGIVTANFDNGLKKAVYKIPVATFPNPEGLTHINGSIYDENLNAGVLTLQAAGKGSAGTIVSNALENSSTDTSEEFNKMIIAQQAYSASSQLISTVSDMYETLIQAVR